jgi:hypothetical protein
MLEFLAMEAFFLTLGGLPKLLSCTFMRLLNYIRKTNVVNQVLLTQAASSGVCKFGRTYIRTRRYCKPTVCAVCGRGHTEDAIKRASCEVIGRLPGSGIIFRPTSYNIVIWANVYF